MFRTTECSSSGNLYKQLYGILSCTYISIPVADRMCLIFVCILLFLLHIVLTCCRRTEFCLPLAIISVLEQPMYYNRESLCALCDGKEGARAIYISLVLMNYRNLKQHAADYCFGTNHYVSFGFG